MTAQGFVPRTYGDLVAIASLLAMFISLVLWGLKIEHRNDLLAGKVSSLEIQVASGILPRAEERLHDAEMDIIVIQEHIRGHEH